MYENSKMCSECGGKCCKSLPGANFPDDFDAPIQEEVKKALKSGQYTIDSWEGDARLGKEELSVCYFIRPAVKGKEGELTDYSWGGECTFLSLEGCTLLLEKRPTSCKVLEPKEKGNCFVHQGKDKRAAAIAWIPYTEMFENLISEYEGE